MRLATVPCFCLAFGLLGSPKAGAQPVQVCLTPTALTNNTTQENYPSIDGDVIVWDGDNGIYRWDGSTIAKIPGTSATSEFPDVSGSLVTWNDLDGSATNDNEIYLWDADVAAPPAPITNNEVDDQFPRISGTNVVWHSPNFNNPATSIHMWNGTTTIELTDPDAGEWDRRPAISGSTVVWEGRVPPVPPTNSKIFVWGGTGEAPLASMSWTNEGPAISDARVVWEHRPFGSGKYDIWLWDGTQIEPLTNTPDKTDRYADISGNLVVWSTHDGNDWEIMLWDGDTDTTYQLTCNSINDVAPKISGPRVAWVQGDGSSIDFEIMTAIANPFSLTFPLPDRSPCTAEINSVFDHSMVDPTVDPYDQDGVITPYTNQRAQDIAVNCAQWECDCTHAQPAYPNADGSGADFLDGNYTGAQSGVGSVTRKNCLNYDGHPAIDYRAACGTVIYAAASGQVSEPTTDSIYSDPSALNMLRIDHGNGYRTVYLHNSTNTRTSGHVDRGEPIALVGAVGTNGCHLHFEVRRDIGGGVYKPVDPYGWLADPSLEPYAFQSVDLWTPTGAPAQVAGACPGTITIPPNQSLPQHVLGGSGVPGGVDVVVNDPIGGTFDAEFVSAPLQDAETLVADPASINFALPERLQLWKLNFQNVLVSLADLTIRYFDPNYKAALYVYHYIPEFEGCTALVDCGWVFLPIINHDTEQNWIRIQTTSFSQFVLGGEVIPPSPWTFAGTAVGGTIDFTVGAVWLQVVTAPGQTAAQVAFAVAAAINGNATLAAAGITASAAGTTVTTNGSITSSEINDPGLTDAPANVPALGRLGVVLLAVAILTTSWFSRRRRTGALPSA